MLSELNKILEVKSGLGCIRHDSLASPSFVLLHFVSEYLRDKGQVIYISLHTSLDLLKINAGKLAIKIDQSFKFISLKECLHNLEFDNLFKHLEELLKNTPSSSKSLLIFDDLSVFSTFGLNRSQTLRFIQRLRKLLPLDSLVLFTTYNDEFVEFLNTCNLWIDISLISTGFGKSVTGKIEVFQRKSPFESLSSKFVYNYLLGERSVNLFLPGSAQVAFI